MPVVTKHTGESLTWVAIRLKEHINVRVNKVIKVGKFKQATRNCVSFTWIFYENGYYVTLGHMPLTWYCEAKHLMKS